MTRILLADTNPTLRSALALLLETRLGVQVIGQVSSMESLLFEADATRPDIIILDWDLPGEPVVDRMASLRKKAPHACVVIYSARPEILNQVNGADATMFKTDPPELIVSTVQSLIY